MNKLCISLRAIRSQDVSLTNLLAYITARRALSSPGQIKHGIQVNYKSSYLNHKKPKAMKLIKRLFTHLHVWYLFKKHPSGRDGRRAFSVATKV